MKNISIQLLTLFLSFSFGIVYSQDCKSESDPFTGEEKLIYDYKSQTIVFEKNKDLTLLKLKFNLSGEINMVIKKGTPLLLKTDAGKIIDLRLKEDAVPVSQVSGTRVISVFVFTCELSAEMLANLSDSRVVLIRHPDGKGSQYDLDAPKSLGKAFMEGANFMMNS